jgi:hypothetical protein
MFVVLNNFRGTPSTARGGSFWAQRTGRRRAVRRPVAPPNGGYCHYNYYYLGAPWWYAHRLAIRLVVAAVGGPETMGCATRVSLSNYNTTQFPLGTLLYAVRADAVTGSTTVHVNDPATPLLTAAYGTTSQAVAAVVGGVDPLRADVADFRLWRRRMDNAEFVDTFNALKTQYGIA